MEFLVISAVSANFGGEFQAVFGTGPKWQNRDVVNRKLNSVGDEIIKLEKRKLSSSKKAQLRALENEYRELKDQVPYLHDIRTWSLRKGKKGSLEISHSRYGNLRAEIGDGKFVRFTSTTGDPQLLGAFCSFLHRHLAGKWQTIHILNFN
jgi:hypothetical protein